MPQKGLSSIASLNFESLKGSAFGQRPIQLNLNPFSMRFQSWYQVNRALIWVYRIKGMRVQFQQKKSENITSLIFKCSYNILNRLKIGTDKQIYAIEKDVYFLYINQKRNVIFGQSGSSKLILKLIISSIYSEYTNTIISSVRLR